MSPVDHSEEACERIRLALLAHREGEPSEVSASDCQQHLSGCAACRRVQQEEDAISRLLSGQTRNQVSADLWQRLEPGLAARSIVDPTTAHRALLVCGTLLLAYKAYELAPDLPLGVPGRLLPVLCAVLFFAYLRENPLRIVTENA